MAEKAGMEAIKSLLKMLEKFPKYDRGIDYENRGGRQRLTVYSDLAPAFKFILDHTDAVINGLRLVNEAATIILKQNARERELLEANNRYLEEAREARRQLKAISAVNQITVSYDGKLADQIAERLKGATSRATLRQACLSIGSAELRNILATMQSIDRHELAEVDWIMSDGEWASFKTDPYLFFLHTGDVGRSRLIAVINKRIGGI